MASDRGILPRRSWQLAKGVALLAARRLRRRGHPCLPAAQLLQLLLDDRVHELVHVAAEGRDLAHER